MSMMREEAIARIKDHMEHHGIGKYPSIMLGEALDLAISALRGPTREMVDRMRGEWIKELRQTYIPVEYDEQGEVILHDFVVYRCSICGRENTKEEPFCNCGAPMTDEAVDILWQKLREVWNNE